MPFLFKIEKIDELFNQSRSEFFEITKNIDSVNAKLNDSSICDSDPIPGEMLATTPTSGSDLVDKVHRDIGQLAEFGRVVLREHLQNMKEHEFTINTYDDKNRPIYAPIQQMGTWLLSRKLFPILEEYWSQIDEEIKDFNLKTGKRVNRGIPLANTGVAQIVQGKTIIGLFNIYQAYQDDRECLQHIPSINIDPEKDMAKSVLFTQFEDKLTRELFTSITKKYSKAFHKSPTLNDLSGIIDSLGSEKKLLLYMILYRYSSASALNSQLTTVISRSEIIRSLAELALWFEDEIKRKDTSLRGSTLGEILDRKIGQLNPPKEGGKYTMAEDLDELRSKIIDALNTTDPIEIINGRIMTCLRNFAGHNLDVQDHKFFEISDEVFARMISLIFHTRENGWI